MLLDKLSARDASALLHERKISCSELLRSALSTIQRAEPEVHAFASLCAQRASQRAETVQAMIDAGDAPSPLAGLPMAVKDNLCTDFAPSTCASRMLADFRPPYNAAAVEAAERAGALPIGKSNLDAFDMGGSTDSSLFGPSRNPWDFQRSAGGGGAAAVAAGEVFFALDSDSGGALRRSCAYCGVSGLRPTFGAVSRHGLIAAAPSFEQVGPIARSIRDCAAVLGEIAGRDPRDSRSAAKAPLDFSTAFSGTVENLRIGLPRECFAASLDGAVAAPILAAARVLESLGASLSECDFPAIDWAVSAYYAIACAEASSSLGRYDGLRYGFAAEASTLRDRYEASRGEGFAPEAKRRLLLGALLLSENEPAGYLGRAMGARDAICAAFAELFTRYDLILMPCTPGPAPLLGAGDDPLAAWQSDRFTAPASLAGLPAAAIPCGFSPEGLPVGLQLVGPAFSEPLLVQAAHAFQQNSAYHLHWPREVAE